MTSPVVVLYFSMQSRQLSSYAVPPIPLAMCTAEIAAAHGVVLCGELHPPSAFKYPPRRLFTFSPPRVRSTSPGFLVFQSRNSTRDSAFIAGQKSGESGRKISIDSQSLIRAKKYSSAPRVASYDFRLRFFKTRDPVKRFFVRLRLNSRFLSVSLISSSTRLLFAAVKVLRLYTARPTLPPRPVDTLFPRLFVVLTILVNRVDCNASDAPPVPPSAFMSATSGVAVRTSG